MKSAQRGKPKARPTDTKRNARTDIHSRRKTRTTTKENAIAAPVERKRRGPSERVLVISDLQAPFQHRDAYDFVIAVAERYSPTQIVCIGDEVDMHALSDYDHDPDGMSPGDELKKAIDSLQPWYLAFPEMMVCISNHTSRPFRRAYKFGIPKALMKDYRDFLHAPTGWAWKDHWIIDGVRYEHGHELGGGYGKTATANAPLRNGRSTVFGHFHANAGIHYVASPEKLMFGFNVGCLIDFKSYAFAYAKGTKQRPILGCGVVDEGIPTFIPMVLNSRGRWVRQILGGER